MDCLYKISERFFDGMLALYDHGLRWVIAHKVPVLLITIATFFLNVYLFILRAERIFPGTGYRPTVRFHAGLAGHLLQRDAGEADGAGEDRAGRSGACNR